MAWRWATDAADALRARAYVPQQTFVRDAGQGVRHTCDLHWRVSSRGAFSRILPWERLASEARPSPALDTSARVPTLIWLYDIHLLASSMNEDEAARFVTLAVDSGLAAICARGLALSRRHFRTPLPAAFDHLVAAGDEPLAAYMDHAFRPFDALVSDLRALEGRRARWRLLREHLFPPSPYLRAARSRLGSGPLPWVYARRIVWGVSRWFHAARES